MQFNAPAPHPLAAIAVVVDGTRHELTGDGSMDRSMIWVATARNARRVAIARYDLKVDDFVPLDDVIYEFAPRDILVAA